MLDSTTVCLHLCKYFQCTEFVPSEILVSHNLSGTVWDVENNTTPKQPKVKYPLQHPYYAYTMTTFLIQKRT